MENTWLTVLGICFIFAMTTLGSAVVFLFKRGISSKLNATFLGFAAGVMIAASVWSLLLPALESAEVYFPSLPFLPVALGLLLGGVFLSAIDRFLPKEKNERASMRLFSAVTLHNIPEGLAVGFAFGATGGFSALGLAVGIGVQNLPEGAAVSLPMKRVTKSNTKAFLWGVGSGIAEPIFACLGYFLSAYLLVLQPWLLAFSAGAMLFVSAQDLIPDAREESAPSLGAWSALIGFALMMVLDIALNGA